MASYQEEARHFFAQARMSSDEYLHEVSQAYATIAQAAAMLAIMEDVHVVRTLIQKSEEAHHKQLGLKDKPYPF